MAFRKEILQKLRTKHKSTPKVILEKLADHLDKLVEKEDEVETNVEDADDLVKSFTSIYQAEGDRRAEEALKGVKTKTKEGEGDEENPADPKTPGTDDKDTPAWAKALIDSNKTLNEKLAALEQGKTIENRKQLLSDKLKGVDETFSKSKLKDFSRINFNTQEEFEEYLEEVENDAKEFAQNLSNKGLGSQTHPLFSGSTAESISPTTQAFIDSKSKSDTASPLGGKTI